MAEVQAERPTLEMAEVQAERSTLEMGLKNLVAGGVASCTSKTAVAPLDRVKILLQVRDDMEYGG